MRSTFGKRQSEFAAPPEQPAGAPASTRTYAIICCLLVLAAGAAFFGDLGKSPWTAEQASPSAKHGIDAEADKARLFDGVPNVSISYYEIYATDAEGIRAELDSKGPQQEGRRYDALTRWNYRWRWDGLPDGSCGVANAAITFEARVTLPRVANMASLSPKVAQEWRSYADALAEHEAGHVRVGYDGWNAVADAVRSAECETANAAGDQAIRDLYAEDIAFDARTDHGRSEGAVFPAG